MKDFKTKWIERIKYLAEDRCKRIAKGIQIQGRINLAKAIEYTSNTSDYSCFIYRRASSREIEYQVDFNGHQIAFLEFGTGIYNEPFMTGVSSDYVPRIADGRVPPRGAYGKGRGKRYAWGFYYDTNVSSKNGDWVATYKKYTTKEGYVATYPLARPIIITHGIKPQRMIYNAVRTTLRSYRKK